MEDGISRLSALVADGDVAVLSGAGLSTESGIPDYRGPSGQSRARTPMTYQMFTGEPDARRRYWARSHVGWRTIARASPNAGHEAVAALERAGLLTGIITQNVDGLHQAAGAHDVVELHGGLDRVICLDCGETSARETYDARMAAANPEFSAEALTINPDGDVEIDEELEAGFRVPACAACGDGLLKPDVVFFGETVPRDRVQECFARVESARLLLVLGSSLTVMSGRRFVLRAAKLGIPVAIVNRGVTRGDAYAGLRLDAPLGITLTSLARQFQS
ncbi:NAD-dependent SIR2 family protein deacetylase [Catenuloplanes nepalensis]|uniref:NAD-dependent protein deacetylase n=1 Tax=Catenuloplanes nepalensis TaxID=587533 RepID=A0ABT9MWM7_9ACTN|nr:NAD-dependent protein deacetylase [Catenuloplanes nepalensis]MDP9795633.1 NAD-dependent SIR2 family protein deacetylase [Catenuloplanes nepalensis]